MNRALPLKSACLHADVRAPLQSHARTRDGTAGAEAPGQAVASGREFDVLDVQRPYARRRLDERRKDVDRPLILHATGMPA